MPSNIYIIGFLEIISYTAITLRNVYGKLLEKK